MRSSTKADSARIMCLSLFLVCSFASAHAQDGPSSESQPIVSIESPDAGTIYKVPGVSDAAQPSSATGPALSGNFFQRLGGYYKADWTGKLPSSSTPRRALDAPLDSPPFPSSDWGYGGSSPIGVSDGGVYPLMTALGKQNSRTKVYGWIAASVNGSTSSKSNFPLSYDVYPNSVVLNQAVIYLERLPNTVQSERHFDWGYHLTAFYGNDYRFTTAKDYLSQQLLQKNRRYGFDPVLEYLDLYFPVKEGLDIRFGRFLSVPGIEAQLAPNNYNMSHSLLYTIDPFTDTGAIASLKLTKQWMVQLGISAGHDVAPWSDDAKASAIACLNDSTKTNRDNFYICANGINDGKYAYNNLQHYDATWYHKFNAKWHMATEAWYMYERDVPNVAGNVANPVPTEIGANGAFCAPGKLTCMAPEYAIVNYVNREFNPHLFVGFRSDVLNDQKGQRTGIPASTPKTRCMRRSTSGRRSWYGLRSASITRGTVRATTSARRGTSSSSVST